MIGLMRCVWVIAFSLFMIQAAFSQAGLKDLPPGKWWTNRRVIAQLKLSADQQAKVEALWMQNRRALVDLKAELEKRQVELSEQVGRNAIDENAALRAFDRMIEARSSLERATFLMRIQIKNQLSPDQQKRLETISELFRQQKAGDGATVAPAPVRIPLKK